MDGDIEYLAPLVLRDRMFDTNGQLFFPTIGINPEQSRRVHIVDHEDNEMMRPYAVTAKTDGVQTYLQGTDY